MKKNLLVASLIVSIVSFSIMAIGNILALVQSKEFPFGNLLLLIITFIGIILAAIGVGKRKEDEYKLLRFSAGMLLIYSLYLTITAISALTQGIYQILIFSIFSFVSFFFAVYAVVAKNNKQQVLTTYIAGLLLVVSTVLIQIGSGFIGLHIYSWITILQHLFVLAVATLISAAIYKELKKNKKGSVSSSSSTATSSNSEKVNKIKEYQEKYGMTLIEAKEAVDAEERAEKAKQAQGLVQDSNQGANVQNQVNMSGATITPVSNNNPLPQTYGLGLDMSAFEQPQKAPSSEDVADLKRQLLQGKITRAEFDEKMAELKK